MRANVTKSILFALVTAMLAIPMSADASGRNQLLASVSRDLPIYVPGADARDLTTSQLAALHMIFGSKRPASYKTSAIRSVLGGPYSLSGSFGIGFRIKRSGRHD